MAWLLKVIVAKHRKGLQKEVLELSDKVVVMNFTGVYDFESFSKNRNYEWIDCSQLSGTDCYCDEESVLKLKKMISTYPVHGIHFIDSGDFHYVSKFWTDRIHRPFSLIVFDHHPDMQPPQFGEILSCGDWVKEALDSNPFLKKVILIGASDQLIQQVPSGYEDRVRFYSENSLEHEETWTKFRTRHLDEPVYISIDKDVLCHKDVCTNWDQGSMTLPEMECLLDLIFKKEEVLGVDICGEFSPSADVLENEAEARVDNAANEELVEFIAREDKQ